jgi:hypothetical protein
MCQTMIRQILMGSLLCLALTGCSSDSDDDPVEAASPMDAAGLNPEALRVEQPPTSGRLPADLEPPANY